MDTLEINKIHLCLRKYSKSQSRFLVQLYISLFLLSHGKGWAAASRGGVLVQQDKITNCFFMDPNKLASLPHAENTL